MAAQDANASSTMRRLGQDSAGTFGNGSLLKERAYAEIKQHILTNGFTSGSFLSERQMALQLGMSKTPVRAALERLEHEGFVTISPQQGIIVRDLSIHEIADQYEIRAALETFVVRSLAGRLTAAQIGRLRANLKAQENNSRDCDVERGVVLDGEFHMMFCEFLGNQEILHVMGQLRAKIHRVISQVFKLNAGRFASSYQEHRGIAGAVLKGDAALAARRVEEHLERGKRCLLSPREGGPP